MPILTAEALAHAYGVDELFHQVTVAVEPRDRIGLVGPNGVGKTTLLLILAGLLEPASGYLKHADELTIGYLRQEAVLTFAGRENTVYEEMLTVFSDLRRQEAELQGMEHNLAHSWSAEFLEAYGQAQMRFELAGGYQYQTNIKRVLTGLGFEPAQWQLPLLNLSGGEKTRVLLGRLLLERPSLLILDEPTNHLDVGAIEWLEATLRRWEGALIIVSHDRFFLDRVVNRIWELAPADKLGDPATLTAFRGDYSNYVRRRREIQDRAERLFEEEKARLQNESEFIRKHIAGGQTDIAKGRLRQLSRDLALISQFGLTAMAELRRSNRTWIEVGSRVRTLSINEADEQIRALRSPVTRMPRLGVQLDALERSSRTVLRLKNALIGWPERPLFSATQLKLERGDRVALLGPNGSGKSTLLRTIACEVEPLAGEVILGDDVHVGYFAQAHDQLNMDWRVIDEVLAQADVGESEARDYLARYLFRGDDVFKLVGELSGGERGRLALGLLAMAGANFLLLDEPTNHLDIPSQEALQAVLEAYDGTLLLVSHDRYLVNRLAERIWSLENGELVQIDTSYQAFLQQRDAAGRNVPAEADGDVVAFAPVSVATPESKAPVATKGWDRDARRADARRRKAVETNLGLAEERLAQVTDELDLARETGADATVPALEEVLAAVKSEVEELLEQWELLR